MSYKNKLLIVGLGILASCLFANCREPLEYSDNDPSITGALDTDNFVASGTDSNAQYNNLCGPNAEPIFDNTYSPYRGGTESVDLIIEDFSYFNCGACASFAQEFEEIWSRNPEFMKRVRLYFHHFPFAGTTAWSLHAAAHAAGLQGMENFWALHDYKYGVAPFEYANPTPEQMRAYAADELHLDMDAFDEAIDPETDAGKATYTFLTWDKSQGQNANITHTPSIYICGKKIDRHNIEEIVQGYLDK